MNKYLKIAIITVIIIVALIAAAAVIIPRVMEPNQYKGRIIALVKAKTGRDLKLPGDISISVFPWLGATIGEAELGNADGFQAEAFAKIQQVKLRVKLFPLLKKNVAADVVSIRGLILNLERDQDGRANWDDLIKASPTPPAETSDTASTPAFAALAVGGVDIRDALVTWTDQAAGTHIAIKNLSVQTSAVNLVDPVTVALGFDLDTGPAGVTAAVDTGAQIVLDLDNQRYSVRELALKADLKGGGIPGGSMAVAMGGDAAFDADTQRIDLKGLKLNVSGLTLASYSAGADIETDAAGDLTAGTFDLKGLRAALSLTGEQERVVAGLTGNARADLGGRKMVISELAITVPELVMNGINAKIDAPGTGTVQVDLTAGTFSADGLALAGTISGEAIPGKSIPAAFGLWIRGDLNRQAFDIEPLQLEAAGVKGTVNLAIRRNDEAPEVKGSLSVASFNPRDLLRLLGQAPPDTADPKALSVAEINTAFVAGTDSVKIEKLSVRLDETRLTGTLQMKHFQAPEIQINLALDKLQPERYLAPKAAAGPAKRLTGVTLKGDLSADTGFKVLRVAQLSAAGTLDEKIPFGMSASKTVLNLNDQTLFSEVLGVTVDEMNLQAKARVTGISTNPAYTADIQAGAFNLRGLLSKLDLLPETADPKAMSAVAISASLSGTKDAVSVSSLKLRLDDTRIDGKADVTFAPATASVFDIRLDSIDTDRYLPPPKPEVPGKKAAGSVATPGAAAAAIPVETLRGLDLEGNIAAGKLKIANLRLTGLQAQASAKKGLLILHPLSVELYGGSYTGNIRFDAAAPVPRLSLDEKLTRVKAGDLLTDLQGKAPVTGIADADLKLTATGADADALLRTLDGNVSFQFADGSIKGVDIAGRICRTLTAVGTGSLKTEDLVGSALQILAQKAAGIKTEKAEADRTTFSEMGGSMSFANGVGTSKDLMIKSPLMRVQGAGTFDMTRKYLDYQATAALVKSCEGQGGKSLGDLANVPIPVAITGPLDKLSVKPDLTTGILQILKRSQEKQAAKPVTPSTQETPPDQQPAPPQPREQVKPVEDAVVDILKDLLKPTPDKK